MASDEKTTLNRRVELYKKPIRNNDKDESPQEIRRQYLLDEQKRQELFQSVFNVL